MITAAWICLLSPLAAALMITLGGTRLTRRLAGYLATLSVLVSFVAALVTLFLLLDEPAEERSHASTLWTWLSAGDFEAGLSILVDPLSVFMMLVVSGVGFLIVAYSIGYMDGSDEERRYFAYMALFVFSMLLLVQSGDLVILLAGWGLVGLCSYLLIGYEQERPAAIAAAKKAFIMNAFGDATMALSLFLLIQRVGTLEYAGVFDGIEQVGGDWAITLIALGLLGGAVAKSAQIPLHTWLPDAMEGPTPVSALIHAATMVVAGAFLLVRLNPVFEQAPRIQDLAAGLGAITLLVAGLIALVQTDIKRVIAYSTMSQIGYMFLGAGLTAYGNSMFHLMTHAFFKALLFLGAGIVIHALVGNQEMRNMGGLGRILPKTFAAMLIGALALAGIPPLAGFFSKDPLLAAALDAGAYGQVLWAVGLAGTFLTGLYAFRMIFIVFGGEPSPFAREHLHRPGHTMPALWMAWTVGALAVLSVIGGWIQFSPFWHPLSNFLEPVAAPGIEPSGLQDAMTSVLSVGLGALGIGIAWWIYSARRAAVPRFAFGQRVLEHKFYVDELYDAVFYRPAAWLAAAAIRFVEGPLISGSIRGVTEGARLLAARVTEAQTGLLRTYALALGSGAAILTLVFLAVRA
ncbi:MAG TPA: NADH-quinone oxidoreductase subunit L [Gaiellaceae bacterium]|jgi:NADH-quinone oxidoreductase subunit L|nr:NADH-quinone oxidoreductase subunit L [Gaiellaceae bacterium]